MRTLTCTVQFIYFPFAAGPAVGGAEGGVTKATIPGSGTYSSLLLRSKGFVFTVYQPQ